MLFKETLRVMFSVGVHKVFPDNTTLTLVDISFHALLKHPFFCLS